MPRIPTASPLIVNGASALLLSLRRGLLRPVERVEETGEGLGVGREIVPPVKVPGHFAHHIGLARVILFIEEVIVNANGKQHIPMFAVFLLQGALDFANDGLTFERLPGADHHQLVIMPDGGVPLTSNLLRLPRQRPVDSYPASPADSPTAWPAPHKAHRRKPGHVGGKAPECLGTPAPG
jgi:hypothetical protein